MLLKSNVQKSDLICFTAYTAWKQPIPFWRCQKSNLCCQSKTGCILIVAPNWWIKWRLFSWKNVTQSQGFIEMSWDKNLHKFLVAPKQIVVFQTIYVKLIFILILPKLAANLTIYVFSHWTKIQFSFPGNRKLAFLFTNVLTCCLDCTSFKRWLTVTSIISSEKNWMFLKKKSDCDTGLRGNKTTTNMPLGRAGKMSQVSSGYTELNASTMCVCMYLCGLGGRECFMELRGFIGWTGGSLECPPLSSRGSPERG